uniref:probable transcription factor At1g61730 n=1 Tax=Erigeron canadensis TaxID=72917 RepID=UPI001CB919D7|nr:probable transcription factor At1g61730 [Erigeron canadensis]
MAGSENEHNNSSSGEEEEEEEEEVSSQGSESESEPDKTSTPPPSSKKTQITSNSSSSSESDSEPEPVPDPTIKPISSKSMDLDAVSKKPRSKIPTSRFSPPPSTGKRPAEVEDDGGDVKRAKKETVVAVAAPDAGLVADNGGEKKGLFQRLWSEENEIELIQGMINYVEKKGKDPSADVNDFHEFVKESLHVDVNDKQVLTKVRRLRKKYLNNASKVEKDGKVRSFSNPHEKIMYDLSKSLWGSDGNKNVVKSSIKKVNVTPKTINKSLKAGSGNGEVPANEGKVKALSGHVLDGFCSTGLVLGDEGIMKKGLELLSGAKKIEMMKKWKELKVEELKHFMKKVDILKEQAGIVVDAIDKSGAN